LLNILKKNFSGTAFDTEGTVKHLLKTTKYLQANLVDWVMFKVPELFVIIYGK